MGVSSATTSVLRMIVCRVLKQREDYAYNSFNSQPRELDIFVGRSMK
jgi:hypothetical protein